MSGFEVAGILLAVFPLIISALENWRDVSKVGNFFWRIRKEYGKCRHDMLYHEILYRRNLQELLLPIINDRDEVDRLLSEPGGQAWSSKAIQDGLQERLQTESYELYMTIIGEMNEVALHLRKQLSIDDPDVQSRLAPSKSSQSSNLPVPGQTSRLAAVKSKWDYETFRLRFSFNEQGRNELFDRLMECNNRLDTLLRKSDAISALQNPAPTAPKGQISTLETVFKSARKKATFLFKAFQKSWHCSCQQYHFANLRLEHRTTTNICFDVILAFVAPLPNMPWSWKELQCGQLAGCSAQNDGKPNNGATPQPVLSPQSVLPPEPVRQPLRALQSSRLPAPVWSLPSRSRQVAFRTAKPAVPEIELHAQVKLNLKLC
jgi:hypothetical protein